MFNRLAFLLAFAAAPLAVACASGDDSHGDSSEIRTSSNEGTLGAQCGGFAGIGCAQGFTCITNGGFADALGTCEPLPAGSEGATCGGLAALPCNEGLACQKPAGSEGIADATGVCAKPAPAATCHAVPGCDSGDTKVAACAHGLTCYTRTVCGATILCAKN